MELFSGIAIGVLIGVFASSIAWLKGLSMQNQAEYLAGLKSGHLSPTNAVKLPTRPIREPEIKG